MHHSTDSVQVTPPGEENVCVHCGQPIAQIGRVSPKDPAGQNDGAAVADKSLSNRKGGETQAGPLLQRDSENAYGLALSKLRLPYQHLTAREEQVARLAAEGLSNAEIGERLNAKIPTVKSHLQNIFVKTDVKRRSQLVTLFAASKTTAASKALEVTRPRTTNQSLRETKLT